MNGVIEIIQKVTDFILHLDIAKLLNQFKPVVAILALVAMILILIGALFSLIPQF